MKLSMRLFSLVIISQSILSTAVAQQEGPQKLSFVAQLAAMAPMFLIIMAIFYFLVIAPQNREEKKQQSFIDGLKKGASVTTSSGIIARVAGIEKDYILLEVANGVKMKFLPSHVRQIAE